MSRPLRFTLVLAFVHLVLGNIAGWISCQFLVVPDLLTYFFAPYTFIWGLSCMVGWDGLSLILMFFGFVVVAAILFPIGSYLANRRK